jgi:hypothetical protein
VFQKLAHLLESLEGEKLEMVTEDIWNRSWVGIEIKNCSEHV